MFAMSVKPVPGCLVSIAPMLIGVPVAATPGLVPQAEVRSVVVGELDARRTPASWRAVRADAALLELELELQAARTPSDSAASVGGSSASASGRVYSCVLPSCG